MKKVISLDEKELAKMIHESVKKILKESYSLEQPYYDLMEAIDAFQEAMGSIYDINDGEVKEAYMALDNAKNKVNNMVRHPEGPGNVWDRVGY